MRCLHVIIEASYIYLLYSSRRDGGIGRRSGLKIRRVKIRVGSTPTPGTTGAEMPFLIIALAYLVGSFPTAHIAGHLLGGKNIRDLGDGNVGAANAFREIGARVGLIVGIVDAGKGALVVVLARLANVPETAVLGAGLASVIGHNWPLFLGFRGGRGASTTIGVLTAVLTAPMLILGGPTIAILIIARSATITCAVMFISLPVVCWMMQVPGVLIAYGVALPCLVGLTHLLRTHLYHPVEP